MTRFLGHQTIRDTCINLECFMYFDVEQRSIFFLNICHYRKALGNIECLKKRAKGQTLVFWDTRYNFNGHYSCYLSAAAIRYLISL